MKTKTVILILHLLIISLSVSAKNTYIPRYTSYIEIVNGTDSARFESDKTTLYADESSGMFRIAIIHETLTLQRIKYIKRLETAQSLSILSAVLSGVSSLSGNSAQRFRGQTMMYASGVLANIYEQNISAAKKLEVEICIENVSQEEIMIADKERGLVWYIQAGAVLQVKLQNPEIVQLRVSDLHHQKIRYVTAGGGSTLRDAKLTWENEQYWVFPFLETDDDGEQYANEYFVMEKLTGEQRKITKAELKLMKKGR